MRSVWEGEACLPRQTHTQPRNGKQMNRMMATRTVSLPMAVGGDKKVGMVFLAFIGCFSYVSYNKAKTTKALQP